MQFIDSARFMACSLSNLVNKLSEGIHRIKCKFGHDDKKCEACEIKFKEEMYNTMNSYYKYTSIRSIRLLTK